MIERIRHSDNDEELTTLVAKLKNAIEYHVHEEEADILPKARAEIPEAELEQLGERFDEAKDAQR